MPKKTKQTVTLHPLSESALKRWISTESLARSRRYFANGAITSPRRVGATLKAECAGSRLTPYTCGAVLPSRGSDARAEGHCRR
ncbi:hypothetical protein TFLX_04461 [Thermoflexales bacterium]|nr:hypothetical protein TFLX_04461 [Thermoflexales bacterium]